MPPKLILSEIYAYSPPLSYYVSMDFHQALITPTPSHGKKNMVRIFEQTDFFFVFQLAHHEDKAGIADVLNLLSILFHAYLGQGAVFLHARGNRPQTAKAEFLLQRSEDWGQTSTLIEYVYASCIGMKDINHPISNRYFPRCASAWAIRWNR